MRLAFSLLLLAALAPTGCDSLNGNAPRASPVLAQPPAKDAALTATGLSKGLGLYGDHCEKCHGPYNSLATAAAAATGQLAGISLAVAKAKCPKLPTLTAEEWPYLIKTLDKLVAATPAKSATPAIATTPATPVAPAAADGSSPPLVAPLTPFAPAPPSTK